MALYSIFFKSLIDFLISLILFFFLSPVFLLLTIFLYFYNKGNPFFLQTRPGKDCKLFKVIKFKTMNNRRNNLGELLPDAERITKVGSFIRRTSLDEIPQLFNVIRGDMSLVGPRPLLIEYLPLYNNTQKKRHEVRPGITGWAQVNGRNAISWQQKFEYDVWYVSNISFFLDIKIILMTAAKIFKREGINSPTSVTMEKFTGTL